MELAFVSGLAIAGLAARSSLFVVTTRLASPLPVFPAGIWWGRPTLWN